MRVRILLDEREVYSAPLDPATGYPSSTGKSTILAQSSDKTQSPFAEFAKLGWTFSLYGTKPKN